MKVFSNYFLYHQGFFRINQSLIQCTKACREKMFVNTEKTNYIHLRQCIYFNIKQRLHPQKYTFSLQTCFSLEFFPCKITNIFIWIVCALFDSGADMTFSVWAGLNLEALARQNTEKLLLNPKQFINQHESSAASDREALLGDRMKRMKRVKRSSPVIPLMTITILHILQME